MLNQTTTGIEGKLYLTIYIFITVSIASLNGLLFVLIVRHLIKKRVYSDILLLSNTVANLTMCVPMILFSIESHLGNWSVSSVATCKFSIVIDWATFSIVAISIMLLSVQRYKQMSSSTCKEDFTKRRALYLTLVWLLPWLFWSLLSIELDDKFLTEKECEAYYTTLGLNIMQAFLLNAFEIFNFGLNIFVYKKLNEKVKNSKKVIASSEETNVFSVTTVAIKTKNQRQHLHQNSHHHNNHNVKAFLFITFMVALNLLCGSFYVVIYSIKMFCFGCITGVFWDVVSFVSYMNYPLTPLVIFAFHTKYKSDLIKIYSFVKNFVAIKRNSKV